MRKRSWRGGAAGLAAGVLGPWTAAAQSGPYVIDLHNLAVSKRQEVQMAEQIQQMSRVYAKQLEQLSIAQQQRDAMTGTRGVGALLNGEKERAARRSAPETLQELLQAVGSGQVPSAYPELRALTEQVRREVPLGEVKQVYGPASTKPIARAYERSQRTTQANLALAEQAYREAARRVQAYEQLSDQIDRTADVKASSDLVARLLVENGLTMNELIRLTALALAGDSAERAGGFAVREDLSALAREPSGAAAKPGSEVRVPVKWDQPPFRGVLR